MHVRRIVAIWCGVHLFVPNQAFRWTAFLRILSMTSTASLSLQSLLCPHPRTDLCDPLLFRQGLDIGQRRKNAPVNGSEPFPEYQCEPTRCTQSPYPRRYNKVETLFESPLDQVHRWQQDWFHGEEMLRAVPAKVHQSLVEMVPHELPAEIFLRKSYHCCVSSLWTYSSSTLSTNCPVSRFLQTVGFAQ